MKRQIILAVLMVSTIVVYTQSASIDGTVTENETGDYIIFGAVILFQNDKLIGVTDTGFDGNYNFTNLTPGVYDIEISYLGYETQRIEEVVLKLNELVQIYSSLSAKITDTDSVKIISYQLPLIIEPESTFKPRAITYEEIKSIQSAHQIDLTLGDREISIGSVKGKKTTEYVVMIPKLKSLPLPGMNAVYSISPPVKLKFIDNN